MKFALGFFLCLFVCSFANADAPDFLQNKIVLQAKEMKAETMLRKLAQSQKFNLVLPEAFPNSAKVNIDAQSWPLAKILDAIAESTGTMWIVDNSDGKTVVQFDMF